MMNGTTRLILFLCLGLAVKIAGGQIPKPDDAPKPLSPQESARRFKTPAGFRIELVCAEPLVREPSGVCWDAKGNLYVSELHGYNLEGQYDIEELNKAGKLDRVVRRIQAPQRHKQAAEAGTYGTIKRLHDRDGDGKMDEATIWADRLPPCHGICAARGGIIATGHTQVLFLADRDGDGKAEVKEVLFEGFAKGPLERSVNSPQWGPDHWIYVGRGAGGGTIRGKFLTKPVQMPSTDFRIKSDGTQIEPVVGGTGTLGFAFTESGDRFVVSTRTPGVFVAPLEWRYLARNPHVAIGSLEEAATRNQRVYPTSLAHPWRTRRAADPGFSKYYRDRYGVQESTPSGFFTSACSPLVYQDVTLPGLRGQLLACEPAQNLIHRALVHRDGARLRLSRAPQEQTSEFLTSSDPWFHAIALSCAPDGSIFVVDFYREIIEDYSAIPRYLQQIYQLDHGREFGRIWRLTHASAKDANGTRSSPPADMSRLTAQQLALEVGSPHFWRRQTARRLIVERQLGDAAPWLIRYCGKWKEPSAVINALHALDGLGVLNSTEVMTALQSNQPAVRRQAVRFAERWFRSEPTLLSNVIQLTSDPSPMVRLQVALSLGESRDPKSLPALAVLARSHGAEPWVATAILTSVADRGGALLEELLGHPATLNQAAPLLESLGKAIASRHDVKEFSKTLVLVAAQQSHHVQTLCLKGLQTSLQETQDIELEKSARAAVVQLAMSESASVRDSAHLLMRNLRVESPAERRSRLAQATKDMRDVRLPTPARLMAVSQLATDRDPKVAATLLEALGSGTPQVRDAILSAVFSRKDCLPGVLHAIESKKLPVSFLTAVQRATLQNASDPELRSRAIKVLQSSRAIDPELFDRYLKSLPKPRDVNHGRKVYQERCATCHRAHGIGHTVGPDLSAEFRRREETLIRDFLAPSDSITPGYVTYAVMTSDGRVFNGLLAGESPTSITLNQAEGKQQMILRRNIEELKAIPVSLMPDDLRKQVSPDDFADLLSWLRRPPTQLVLLDENRDLLSALNEGSGLAQFIDQDKFAGRFSLQVTPPQRYSRRIRDWDFRIRERPGPGEYRYLRFAWKTNEGHGVMIELADNGGWPPPDRSLRRYHAGKNSSSWESVEISDEVPRQWTVVTRDLWKDFGDFTLTGFAPTAMGAAALFDRIELLQSLDQGTGDSRDESKPKQVP